MASGASQATLTLYYTQASFEAAVGVVGTDTYSTLAPGWTASPINRSAGAYAYTASTPNDLWVVGTAVNPGLSTNIAADTITFNGFSPGVVAIGGNFFGSASGGGFAAGDIKLVAKDSAGPFSLNIGGAQTGAFFGFVSDTTLLSLTVSAVQPAGGFLWPTVDNLVLANAAPVPEPETYALMLAGLVWVGLLARRRG
jgi:hypothetical protein